MTHIGNGMSRRVAPLAVILSLAFAAACGGELRNAVDPACAGLEAVPNHDGLISRNEAEEQAVEWLAMSAPEVTGTEVERVWASCLTTFRSNQRDLLEGRAWTNPEVRSPDMPVWIVEVKGISRPAGISAGNADDPYLYAMTVMDAETGDSFAGSRHRQPLLEPAEVE